MVLPRKISVKTTSTTSSYHLQSLSEIGPLVPKWCHFFFTQWSHHEQCMSGASGIGPVGFILNCQKAPYNGYPDPKFQLHSSFQLCATTCQGSTHARTYVDRTLNSTWNSCKSGTREPFWLKFCTITSHTITNILANFKQIPSTTNWKTEFPFFDFPAMSRTKVY